MADEVAAPAPVVETTPAAPLAPSAPVAAVDPKIELEALLKKMGGLEVNAGGKKHKVDSVEKLIRYAQRGLPVESSLEEIGRQRSQLEPIAALFQQLQSGSEDEAESALEKLLDSGKLDKVAERRLRKLYEREQKMEGLSPRERELQAELENERGSRTKLEAEQKRVKDEQAAAIETQQVASIKNHISGAIVETLKSLDLGDKLEPLAVEFMKPIIRASLNAGIQLDPAVLAEKVRPILDQLFEMQTRNLDGEKLLARLGPEVGKRYRAALLGQLAGGKAAAAKPVDTKTSDEPKSIWDPRRMF